MREILCRAKVKDKDELIGKGFPIDENGNQISEWVYGVPTPIPGYPDLFTAWNAFNGEYEELTVITETIGQYTGLTDKNGKRIFAQDIIETKYGRICEVIWFSTDTYCGWDLVPIGQYDCKPPDEWDLWNRENLVVIGNIFNNQELLKG